MNASGADTPKGPKTAINAASRTPQPPMEIGNVASSNVGGTTNRHINNSSDTPKARANR